MIFSEIPFKIKNPQEMSTKTTRQQVFNEIKECKSVFQVGCGSGSMSFDFLLNGGQSADLLDRDPDACIVAAKNAEHNKLKVEIINSTVHSYVKPSNKKFDAIIVSTAFLTSLDTISLIENCLEKNGIIITILKEDVINIYSLANMKETIKRCNTEILKPTINPEDGIVRLIYKGIKL